MFTSKFTGQSFKVGMLTVALSLALTGCDGDDGIAGLDGAQGIVGETGANGADGVDGTNGVDGADGVNGADGASLPRSLNVEVVGRFATGIIGKSAAEIVQFHKTSKSAFSVNAAENKIEVIDLTNLSTTAVASPVSDESLSATSFTFPDSVTVKDAAGMDKTMALSDVNSIAIKDDLLALAVQADVKQDNGAVLFYSLNALGEGTFIKAVEVGALPDMVTFTPDGLKVLVANEGEPNTDYSNDPEGSISVISVTNAIPADVASHINMTTDMIFSDDNLDDEDFDTDAKRLELLTKAGVKFAGPAGNTVAKDLEPEYITVSADSKMAYVSLQENNAIGILNLEDLTIEVKALGYKDWSKYQLDFSNTDEVANFKSVQGLYGLYQPDTLASYTWNGSTFIISANEGDSRDYDAYTEEYRIKDLEDDLGKTLSTELQMQYDESGGKDYLGRLKVTAALGDEDDNGEFEKLFTYGARSFSIWDQNANLVFDSGDDFGKISSAILGENFNSAHTENKGDNRSDDKGGEPEAIEVGEVGDRTYAFIAQERAGDLFVYDITNPFNTIFVTHYNNRDFTVDFELDDDLAEPCDVAEGMDCTDVNMAGDLGPESIKFISAEDSPTATALLVIGNEVSGTVTVYQVTEQQ
ncbi:choice-of-anchor I family protein [Colwellia sp. E2M01]|uniref:choice-of-anchor I family protein n=1 Tax=Colwellia sp. E2M01 TaxID=2841561 RepID=UPI001C098EAB|nr:choice-of-anchor I family protein [Colwellia sp. E2M01]MBU2871550.1 choice-of-anchor I family protein [Colwellia sp. E2M01]